MKHPEDHKSWHSIFQKCNLRKIYVARIENRNDIKSVEKFYLEVTNVKPVKFFNKHTIQLWSAVSTGVDNYDL